MKSVISTTACILTVGALLSSFSQAAIIYQDDFNFTGTLNGHLPTQTPGATWTSSDTIWTANGSSVNPGAASRTAYLPFVPENGMIYELTARMSNASGSTGTNWISLGFNTNAAPGVTTNFTGSDGIGTVILRETGVNQTYTGPNVAGTSSGGLNVPGYAADTFYEFKIVLNTTASNWTFDVYRDGTQLDVNGGTAGLTYTWTAGNPVIGSVQLSSNTASGSARYDSFSLVAIPEPSSMLSLITAGALGLLRRRR